MKSVAGCFHPGGWLADPFVSLNALESGRAVLSELYDSHSPFIYFVIDESFAWWLPQRSSQSPELIVFIIIEHVVILSFNT